MMIHIVTRQMHLLHTVKAQVLVRNNPSNGSFYLNVTVLEQVW